MKEKVKYGMVQPRQGRYGVCGWDVMIVGLPLMLFNTKGLALKWMKKNGYEVLANC